jgi:hypothetical protein
VSDFAERFGYAPPIADLAESAMPNTLRAGLWDALRFSFLSEPAKRSVMDSIYSDQFRKFCNKLWFDHFREPIDSIPTSPYSSVQNIRDRFFGMKFFDVYRILEFCLALDLQYWAEKSKKNFRDLCNSVFERERCAFRFSAETLIKISEPEQLHEVSLSISQDKSAPLREHIRKASMYYSLTPEPDYRNSIKESISAVEATVAFVVGRKTTGITRPLKSIADKYEIHQALRDGFEKLYAWTSDESGIRHRLMGNSTVSQDEARYMLVSCSAFSNYLMALHAKFGPVQLVD